MTAQICVHISVKFRSNFGGFRWVPCDEFGGSKLLLFDPFNILYQPQPLQLRTVSLLTSHKGKVLCICRYECRSSSGRIKCKEPYALAQIGDQVYHKFPATDAK